jgi:LacI family transcriptional regulator, galactose operon repressor
MTVRLKDIAVLAGVSIMTVSKALRDAPDISAKTKARIRKIADETEYTPDTIAQGLRSRSSKLFGLIIPAMTNPVFARVVMAVEEHAFEMGYELIVCHSLNQPEREQTLIRRLLSRRVDGLFIVPVYRLERIARVYDELLRRGTPTVLLGHRAPFCDKFVNVETDDITASYTATKHLLELGHRRIAFLAGPPAAPASHERFEGYRRALREWNIEFDDKLVFQAGSTIEEGEKAALQMLDESPGATAVQAVNDLVAIGAAGVFLSQGLRIPENISIVGFGNILISEHFRVPLTTMRQPKLRLGAAAMDSMLKILKGQHPGFKRLHAELIVRQSTGATAGASHRSAPPTGTS